MRPIDADGLLTAFPVDDEPTLTKSCVRMTIQHMPTVDAVPVVRCRECKYSRMTVNGECKYCDIWFPDEAEYVDGDYYCASGERKDGDGNG